MAPALTTLGPEADADEVLNVIRRDGAAIVADVLTAGQVEALLDEVMPYLEATRTGRDDFAGRLTTRTGALVARSPACRELILHPTVLDAARRFLAPWCARIQLHLSQIIRLKPGQPAQSIHRERWAWGRRRPPAAPENRPLGGDFESSGTERADAPVHTGALS